MSQDIVDTSGWSPLVVARRIEHQLPHEITVLGERARRAATNMTIFVPR